MGLVDQPRTLILNNIPFTEEEIKELKGYYPEMDLAVFEKIDVRKKKPVLQKALMSGAIVSLSIENGDKVTLNLTQDGRSLLGKV